MNKLTARQREVLEVIRESTAAQGFPPTRAELAGKLGFRSINAAEAHIRALARKGCIELLPGVSRGIRVIDDQNSGAEQGVPLLGRVAAGSPTLGQEHIETRYHMDEQLFDPKPDYFLRVQGMSMRDAGILDGDLLAVHRNPEARNGQIVVARLESEVTVKRFERQGRRVRLLPENNDFLPIELDLDRDFLEIEGIAVGIIRNGRL